MSFFDRFQKKQQTFPISPVADTICLLLMDRTLDDIDMAAVHLKSAFGDQAVSEISYDHPHVLTFTVTVDGLELWCSYLSMPIPADTADIPTAAQYSITEYLDFLYTMSAFQITERQLYRNAAVIPLDEKTEVVCKQDGDTLFFFGA